MAQIIWYTEPRIMGMIEIAKSWYLYDTDTEKCEAALKKSIEYCPHFSINFRDLGELYRGQGKLEEGNFLIMHASQNLEKALEAVSDRKSDDISLNDFFGQFFAGIFTIDVYKAKSENTHIFRDSIR